MVQKTTKSLDNSKISVGGWGGHALVLFGFWIVLSGRVLDPSTQAFKLDGIHLGIGIICAGWVAWSTRRLMMIQGTHGVQHAVTLPWMRLIRYLPWLIYQIVLSSIHVAKVVMDPRMPIRPKMIRIKVKYKNEVARLTLANSITLTPGTITVDQEGDEYVVHALTQEAAEGLQSGEMQWRVARIFGEKFKTDVRRLY